VPNYCSWRPPIGGLGEFFHDTPDTRETTYDLKQHVTCSPIMMDGSGKCENDGKWQYLFEFKYYWRYHTFFTVSMIMGGYG